MYYNPFGGWSEFGKTMFGPIFELQNINNNVLEQLTRENLNIWNSNLASGIKYMQHFNKSKKGEEVVKMPLELMNEVYTRSLNYTQNICKINEDAAKDYKKWAESNLGEICKEKKSATETKHDS